MQISRFSNTFLGELISDAEISTRKRKNFNVHSTFSDPSQRLFNAIGIDSYIPPHRHSLDQKSECLIAVSGLFALMTFDEDGSVSSITKFGSEVYFRSDKNCDAGVEIPPNIWHTVIAIEGPAILFEVKPGPFDPMLAKELAPWAPHEDSISGIDYLLILRDIVNKTKNLEN
jgi:cupin fold WbuC family metalloprotein